MAKYLKVNKSYIDNDLFRNPNFNMLGPNVINSNFSEMPDGTDVSTLSGWSTFQNATATIEGGKLKVVSDGTNSSASAKYAMSGLTAGKVYELSCKAEGDLSDVGIAFSGYTDVSTLGGNIVFTFKAISTGSSIFFTARNNGNPATVEYSDISVKETGKVEFVDNPYFKGVANDTDVTTLDGWSIASSGYPATSTDVVDQKLVIVSSGIYEGAGYDLTDIPNGEEVNIKIESVTGDNGNGALFLNGTSVDIPTESGSVDYTFIKQSVNTKLMFRAGFNTAGTTTYDNISIQPTNVFAYGWRRNSPGENGNGVKFEEGKLSLTDGFSKLIGEVKNTYLTTNTEFILKYDVLSAEGGEGFRVYSGDWLFPDVSIGSNEFRYINQVGTNGLFTGNFGSNGEITFNSIGLQEVKNQPKLIGVDEVATVSAPNNDTIIINNRYTDGADQVTITYETKEGVSRIDVKNYFQDKIIEAANSNNTDKVISIKPPVLIKDIVSY